MPVLAVFLLIAVYVISAIAEGIFLASLMVGFTGGAWLAYGISGAIQATRGLLVFFPQLNPNRPTFGFQGEAIAVLMGLISIASIWGVVSAVGLPHAVGVSLSILMLAGIGVEIFFLREIKYATEMELFSNRQYWGELKDFAHSKRELQMFLDGLQDYEPSMEQLIPARATGAPTPPEPQPTQQPEPTRRRSFSNAVLNAIGAADNLTDEQMELIRKAIDDGHGDGNILWLIQGFSEKNRREKSAGNPTYGAGIPQPEFYPNGNGQH